MTNVDFTVAVAVLAVFDAAVKIDSFAASLNNMLAVVFALFVTGEQLIGRQ